MNGDTSEHHHIVVLLVDDQMIIGEMLRRMLEDEKDIEYHYCNDPLKAVQTATEVAPSIILQDLVMPGTDGISLVNAYRSNPATKHVPIIVLSSEEDSKVKARAFAEKADDYLMKLPDKIEMLARIRHHAEGYLNTLEKHMMEQRFNHFQKFEAIGSLASGIAHEINTPAQFIGDNLRFLKDSFQNIGSILEVLAAIYDAPAGDAEFLKNKMALLREEIKKADIDFLKTEINDAIEQSIAGNSHIARIVQAVKDFASSSGGRTASNDINKLIESTITISRHRWQPVADMQTELYPGQLNVECCRDEINQVFLNLIINAAEAVAASGKRGVITIRSAVLASFAVISVEDSGTGVASGIKDRIFDPFFTTKNSCDGSGQGLAIAYDIIVRKHNGEIFFDSEEGRGSIFSVKLPMRK